MEMTDEEVLHYLLETLRIVLIVFGGFIVGYYAGILMFRPLTRYADKVVADRKEMSNSSVPKKKG